MSGDGLGGNGTDGIWGRQLPLPCVLPGMHANPNLFVYAFRIRLLAAQVLLAHIQARWVARQEASSALPIHLPAVAKDHPPCFRATVMLRRRRRPLRSLGALTPLPCFWCRGSPWGGLGLAFALAGAAVVETLTVNAYFHILYRIGLHLKVRRARQVGQGCGKLWQ